MDFASPFVFLGKKKPNFKSKTEEKIEDVPELPPSIEVEMTNDDDIEYYTEEKIKKNLLK